MTYRISWYAKASEDADFYIDVRGDGDVKYFSSTHNQFPKMGTDWTYQSVDYTVESGTELSFAFYGGEDAVTYYIDDINILPVTDITNFGGVAKEGTYSISGVVTFNAGNNPKDNDIPPTEYPGYEGGKINTNTITVKAVYPIYINGYLTNGSDDGDDITVMRRYLYDYMETKSILVTVPSEVETPEPFKLKIQVPEQFTTMSVLQLNPLTQEYDTDVPVVFVSGEQPYYKRENNDIETKTIATKYKITFRK
jgi:hypothetical protein